MTPRSRFTPKGIVGLIGLGHMAYLYGWGLLHRPVLTAGVALAWIIVMLHFWPDEKR